MEIILIRHGLPVRVENENGKAADPSLCEAGRSQAERMAAWLVGSEIDALYASPLRRARETAAPLAAVLGLEMEIEPGVVEFDGEADFYIPLEELKRTDYPRWKRFMDEGYGEGIDMEAFHHQVASAIERLIRDNEGRRIAVVCHGGVINAWAAKVLGLGPRLFFDPTYTSINRFMAARTGERSVVSLNESAHLRD
jgi:probable phosphoglycerate mutase